MKKSAALAAFILAVLVVLGGCALSTGGDAPPSADTIALRGIPAAAWSGMLSQSFVGVSPPSPRYAAYFIMLFGYSNALTIEALLLTTLTDWSPTQPTSYTVGGYTFSWTQNGNSWTWTIAYDNGQIVLNYVVTLTSTSSGWDVAISQDGQQWLSGSVTSDGSHGTAVFNDPSAPGSGSVTTIWEPDQAPYAYYFTITGTGSFATYSGNIVTTATVNLEADTAGDYWYWAYSEDGNPAVLDWGQYPGVQ